MGQSNFATVPDLLRQYNLPSKDSVEIIQAFPGDSLVASPHAERTRLLSLIEQRLEQSLLTIPEVINARVHVSYPLNGNGAIKQIQKVSSLVTYSGNEDPKMMMNKIKLFLTSSFAETSYDNVSVIIVNRPPLQYQIKPEPDYSANPILISAIIAVIVVLLGTLFLLWNHQHKNKRVANSKEIQAYDTIE